MIMSMQNLNTSIHHKSASAAVAAGSNTSNDTTSSILNTLLMEQKLRNELALARTTSSFLTNQATTGAAALHQLYGTISASNVPSVMPSSTCTAASLVAAAAAAAEAEMQKTKREQQQQQLLATIQHELFGKGGTTTSHDSGLNSISASLMMNNNNASAASHAASATEQQLVFPALMNHQRTMIERRNALQMALAGVAGGARSGCNTATNTATSSQLVVPPSLQSSSSPADQLTTNQSAALSLLGGSIIPTNERNNNLLTMCAAGSEKQRQEQKEMAKLVLGTDFMVMEKRKRTSLEELNLSMLKSAGLGPTTAMNLSTTSAMEADLQKLNPKQLEAMILGPKAATSSSIEDDCLPSFLGNASKKRRGAKQVFPWKLFCMLQDVEKEGREHIVSFVANGQAFVVHDPKRFENEILPKYFRHGRLASFQRQCLLYGFQRITSGPFAGGYYHSMFQRGQRALCLQMKRVGLPPSRSTSPGQSSNHSDGDDEESRVK